MKTVKSNPSPKENPTRRKLLRPKNFKIADKDTLKKILTPLKHPEPEFDAEDYAFLEENDDSKTIQCTEPNCNARFSNKASLAQHKTKHRDRKKKCTFCGRIFITLEEMTQHVLEFHPDLELDPGANPFQCKKCRKISRDSIALWRHIRETHRNQSYPCPHCKFPFTRPENLKDHLLRKHLSEEEEIPTFHCKLCDKVYTRLPTLRKHIREAHREKGPPQTFRCVICNTIYVSRGSYKVHMSRHARPKFLPCDICNSEFRCEAHLRRHKASQGHKLQAAKKAKMDAKKGRRHKSGMEASTKHNIENGGDETSLMMKLSKEELIHMCSIKSAKIVLWRIDHKIAKKSIARMDKLGASRLRKEQEANSQESEEERDLTCVYCQKDFQSLKLLETHEAKCYDQIRTKQVHPCPHCPKKFDKKYKLNLHSVVHTNERKFQCSFCPSLFKRDNTRQLHEKYAHFGIRYKPAMPRVFKCNFGGCGKQYKRAANLRQHISSHHLKKKFPCKKCGRMYKREDHLRKHLRVDHAKCPIRLECKPCKRTYKDRNTYLQHLERKRHARKLREAQIKKKKGNKNNIA